MKKAFTLNISEMHDAFMLYAQSKGLVIPPGEYDIDSTINKGEGVVVEYTPRQEKQK